MLWKSLISVLLLSSVSIQAFAKSEGDPWANTSVDFTLIDYFAKKVYPCDKNDQYHLACIQLVNAMGSNLKTQQTLIAKGSNNLFPNAKLTVLKDLGPLQLVEVENDTTAKELSPLAANNLFKARNASLVEAAKQSFKVQPKFDFIGLTQTLFHSVEPRPDVSRQALIAGAVGQMMTVVDAHSHINNKASWDEDMKNPDLNLIGIGTQVQEGTEGTIVAHVMDDSPAEKYGVQDGDVITEVDELRTKGVPLTTVVNRIRGVKDTVAHLTIARLGQSLKIDVVRGVVSQKNVDPKIVTDMGIKVLRVELHSFVSADACDQIAKAITSAPSDVEGIILDVRGNPGGLVSQADCIGGLFVGRRTIAVIRGISGPTVLPQAKIEASDRDMITVLPVVVLINNHSASASEFVAGALQDYQRAYIMGTTSFGKGSVQTSNDLPLYNGTIYWFQTTARFYQPLGHTNQQVGIRPDFVVYPRPNMTDEEKFQPREGDLVPGALEAIGETWTQQRSPQIASLKKNCLSANRALATYTANAPTRPGTRNDYQLYSAQELIACLAQGQ